jgi:hypothetical protein
MAEIGEPIRVIEIQPLELPVPLPQEPVFVPAPDEVPVEATR